MKAAVEVTSVEAFISSISSITSAKVSIYSMKGSMNDFEEATSMEPFVQSS